MPKRPLSGDFTLAWNRKACKWDDNVTEEHDSADTDIYWDSEGTWHFYNGDWWLLQEDGWWRKWDGEQQQTANQTCTTDSPEQQDGDVQEVVSALLHMEIKDS